MSIRGDAVLDYFRQHDNDADVPAAQVAACRLLRVILAERTFADVRELASFCQEPANLRAWLPGKIDQRLMAGRLSKGLRDMCSLEVRAAKKTSPDLLDPAWSSFGAMLASAAVTHDAPMPHTPSTPAWFRLP